ncbi:MAG: hypothetical protein JXM70_06185 [Pirellulales bacterium]|nr:hypothetical protein [Pirellulales bacterium]
MLSMQGKQVPTPVDYQRCAWPRAVTLVEVLLVLVVLTLIAATAWPALERSFANQRLRDAADLVRAEWAATRARAMRLGTAQQFHYTPEEQDYWVNACEDDTGSMNGSSSTSNISANAGTDGSYLMLPDKIYFHEGETQSASSPNASTDRTSMTGQSDPGTIVNGEAGAPIVFYPDGTCTSARLVLRNEYDRGIEITIRGLTGMSDSGEVFYVEDHTP